LSTLSIRYINSDKLKQTNCDEFLYKFVVKKAGQNLLNFFLFTVLWSVLLDSMIVAFYFFVCISIMTAQVKFKTVQSLWWALVSSALRNIYMKHYKSVKILSNIQNVKYPCANLNPLFKTFWRLFWFLKPHIFSPDSLVAFGSYQSEKVRNMPIVNQTVTTIWVRFT